MCCDWLRATDAPIMTQRCEFTVVRVFTPQAFEVAKETRTPLLESVRHVGIHVIFHPCTKFSTKGLLAVV